MRAAELLSTPMRRADVRSCAAQIAEVIQGKRYGAGRASAKYSEFRDERVRSAAV